MIRGSVRYTARGTASNRCFARLWASPGGARHVSRMKRACRYSAPSFDPQGRQRYIADANRGYCFVAPVTRQTQDNDQRNRLARPSSVQLGCMADRDEAVLSLKRMLQTERLTRVLDNGRPAIDPKPEKSNSAVMGMVRVFADLIASLLAAAEQVAEAEENIVATRDEPIAASHSPR
jgi:hypothetical protein